MKSLHNLRNKDTRSQSLLVMSLNTGPTSQENITIIVVHKAQAIETMRRNRIPLNPFCITIAVFAEKNEPRIFFARFGSLEHFAASAQLKFGSNVFQLSFCGFGFGSQVYFTHRRGHDFLMLRGPEKY